MIATSSKLSRVWWVPTFFKVGYLLSILVALLLWPDMDVSKFFRVMARWPREGQPIFASHFATWDAAYYLYLSEVGYHAGVPSCAFYPLWPLLVRGFAPGRRQPRADGSGAGKRFFFGGLGIVPLLGRASLGRIGGELGLGLP
ncbi:MAG: hypothetical protein AAB676_08285, partial [Verrucomicrobiota bacterium]